MAINGVSAASPGEVPQGHKPLVSNIQGLFNNSKYSDITIKCGDHTWPAHKNIVCSRSEFFEKATNGEFKEGQTGIIELVEDEPQIVQELLRYLYTSDYRESPIDPSLGSTLFSPLVFNVHIATIADKYDIPHLAELATAKYKKRAAKDWNTDDFANSVEEMYTTVTENKKGMQACAVSVAAEHRKELVKPNTRFREVTKTVPSFADEVLECITTGNMPCTDVPAAKARFQCTQNCGTVFSIDQIIVSRTTNGKSGRASRNTAFGTYGSPSGSGWEGNTLSNDPNQTVGWECPSCGYAYRADALKPYVVNC